MGKENKNGEGDIQKSLDDNLEKLDLMLKSKKSKDDLKEMMKDSDTRKKVKEYLKDYDKDEDEDDDKEAMNGDEDEGEENDDDEGEEEMKGKKKMKKSLDEVVEENEDLIDAVPVLKSFVAVMGRQALAIDILSKKLSAIDASVEKVEAIQKSIGDTLSSSADLIKSLRQETEELGEEIPAPKGARGTQDLVFKSFGGEEGEKAKGVSVPLSTVREILLKSVQTGEVSSNELSKWELGRYNQAFLTPRMKAAIEKNLK